MKEKEGFDVFSMLPEVPVTENVLDENYLFYAPLTELLDVIGSITRDFEVSKTDKRYSYEFNNVIGVTGKRGSGKTAVLITLMNIINNNSAPAYAALTKSLYVLEPVIEPRFFVSSKSIVDLVVSNLYSTFKEDYKKYNGDDSLIEDLSDSFAKIAEAISAGRGASDANVIDDLDGLDRFSELFKLKEYLAELIDKFLVFESQISDLGNAKYTSIVVLIDDLDLDDKSGYEMVSQISKYLKIRNLIILVSYDEETLYDLVLKSKLALIPEAVAGSKLEDESIRNAKAQSGEYIEKLIPADKKIDVNEVNGFERSFAFLASVLDNDEFKVTSDESAYRAKKGTFIREFNALTNGESLRHLTQGFNLIDGYLSRGKRDKASDLLYVRRCLEHLYPDSTKAAEGTESVSDFVYPTRDGKTDGDKQAFLRQASLIIDYIEDDMGLDFSSYFLMRYLPASVNAGRPGLSLLGKGSPLGAAEHPLAFFEALSILYSLPNNREKAKETLDSRLKKLGVKPMPKAAVDDFLSIRKIIEGDLILKDSYKRFKDRRDKDSLEEFRKDLFTYADEKALESSGIIKAVESALSESSPRAFYRLANEISDIFEADF
jgi:hypothetical protein